jgi:cardiolipin synthase
MTLWRHLPNAICILRILMTLPIVVALEQGQYGFALSLFAVAAVSDGVDGYLAKRFGWISELGKFLDPLADKILLVSVFLACVWQELVPVWLAAAAIARDVLISAGSVVFRLWFGELRGRPTWISKLNTTLQLVVLVGSIIQAGWWVIWPDVFGALMVVTLATTIWSGADYVARFFVRAWAQPAVTD